ncbi:hypothetical protein PM082_004384 [Marasmius tenuissimus]|nr:hypothetical protein PM082_004384 [Marasmius tenuissimus]
MEEMMNLNPMVECINCSERHERHFMRWSEAVEPHQRHQFVPVLGELLDVVEKIEEGQKTRRLIGTRWWTKSDEKEEWFWCRSCDFKDTLENLKAHISETHDITTVTVSDWQFEPMKGISGWRDTSTVMLPVPAILSKPIRRRR